MNEWWTGSVCMLEVEANDWLTTCGEMKEILPAIYIIQII